MNYIEKKAWDVKQKFVMVEEELEKYEFNLMGLEWRPHRAG